MSIAYTTWYDEVVPDMPGAPLPVVLNSIKQAAIEFCHGSRVWLEFLPLISMNDLTKYTVVTPTNSDLVRVTRAWYLGKELHVVGEEKINEVFPDDWTLQTGDPKYLVQLDPDNVYLVPNPVGAITDALKLYAALKPTRASTDLPDFIYNRYMDDVTYGAKWKLFAMKSKKWSDPGMATYYEEKFNSCIGDANVDAFKGFGKARPRVKPQFM